MKSTTRKSIQLYSLRTLPSIDAILTEVAAAGFKYVEPFGGQLGDPAELKTLLAKHKLTAPSVHIGMDAWRKDAAAASRLAKGLGVEFAFAPAPPPSERDMDIAGWKKFGKELATIGKVASGEGLKFGWHNHHWEYKPAADGTRPIDVLFTEAPDLLWEADFAWIVRGNADPIAEIARYGSRLVAVHAKDLAPVGQALDEDGWADVGHGTMDWVKLNAAVAKTKCALFVAEHDKPSDGRRFAKRAFATLSKW